MAFSTQKQFLHFAYMNEHGPPKCAKIDGMKLQTYSASTDHRSWSMENEKQAQFLMDLVACRMYSPKPYPEHPFSECNEDESSSIVGGDSLLNAAVDELTRLENLLLEKDELKSQLEVSQEKLRILDEEHQTVNAILTDGRHREVAWMLERKIEQLKCANKFDKNDENELTKILDALVKREKSARILEAQNCYLRRLVAKLSTRCSLEAIRVEPERSTDLPYLQSQVDTLRKEVCLLRELEDKRLQKETASRGIHDSCEDNDSENVSRILAERNALRDKCKNFAAIEAKICQWKREAEQFQMLRVEACNALKKKDENIMLYREDIAALQCEIKKMERCCRIKEQEEDDLYASVDCLRDENQKLREEICKCSVDLKKVSMLQAEVQCLTAKLCEKNCVIDQYDMQFQQLLGVVENLQKKGKVDIVGLQDVHSQTHNEIEELAATTRITLDHIHKELESRNVVECEMARSDEELLEAKKNLAKSKDNLAKTEVNLAQTEENLDLANCEMKLLKKEKELQEALLRANNADCLKIIDELKAQLDQMEQENKRKLEEMVEANKRRLEQMQADMEKEKQVFASERGDFERAKQDFERQKQAWGEEKKNLIAESREGDRLREEFEKERQAWVKERKDFFKERENWEKERQACAKLNADLNKEREEMERIKQNFDKARQVFDKERQEIQSEREGFANERKQFEQSAANFEKLKQEMEKEKQALEAKAAQLAETLSKKEQRRLDSDTEMGNLRNQNDELNKSLRECQNKNDDFNRALKEAQNKNDELNNALKQSQNKNDELNKQLKECQNEVKAQKENSAKFASEVDKLKSEISSSQGQLKEVDGLVKDISNVKDRNEQLSTVVEAADRDCQKQLAEERRKNGELKKQLANANAALGERKHVEKPTEGAADMDCQKLLAEERRKNADLKKQLTIAAVGERKHLEKEMEEHRTSNNALRTSISKLTSKINTRSAADFERELKVFLDNFTAEICRWRCEKNCKRLTKIQEIAKKICEHCLDCLTLKELVYLHQQMCEAARKLTPVPCGGEQRRKERRCCKCSGEICLVPTIPNDILLEKLVMLEQDIQGERENLRKLTKQQAPIDLDEDQELETMRANTYRHNRVARISSARSRTRFHGFSKEEYDEAPTKDRCGF